MSGPSNHSIARGYSTVRRLVRASTATMGLSLLIASAWATEPASVAVDYADLNLSESRDARVLYSRLKAASKDVCRLLESRELARKHAWRTCYLDALSNAVISVDHSALTELHGATRNVRVAQRKVNGQPRS